VRDLLSTILAYDLKEKELDDKKAKKAGTNSNNNFNNPPIADIYEIKSTASKALPSYLPNSPSVSLTNEIISEQKKILDLILNESIATVMKNVKYESSVARIMADNYYSYGGYLTLSSPQKLNGVILNSLLSLKEENAGSSWFAIKALIPKLLNGLLADRTNKGNWRNTQEDCFALLSCAHYYTIYESQPPQYKAKVWVGNNLQSKEQEFMTRAFEDKRIVIPMSTLIRQGAEEDEKEKEKPKEKSKKETEKDKGKKKKEETKEESTSSDSLDLIVQKSGSGALYWKVLLEYSQLFSMTKPTPAVSHGFNIRRIYKHIDHAGDLVLDKSGGNTIVTVKAGARIKIVMEVNVDFSKQHVAVVDYLPAGLEAQNDAVKKNKTPGRNVTPRFQVWDHQNYRRARVEAFTTRLWGGTNTMEYIANATTPGLFVWPPASAEEMYNPEVFGNSEVHWLKVT